MCGECQKSWGGDDRGVEALLGGEHVVDIDVVLRQVALRRLDLTHAAFAVVVGDVADRLEAEAGDVLQAIEEDQALLAESDERDVDGVASATGRGLEDVRGTEHQTGSGGSGSADEAAAGEGGSSFFAHDVTTVAAPTTFSRGRACCGGRVGGP